MILIGRELNSLGTTLIVVHMAPMRLFYREGLFSVHERTQDSLITIPGVLITGVEGKLLPLCGPGVGLMGRLSLQIAGEEKNDLYYSIITQLFHKPNLTSGDVFTCGGYMTGSLLVNSL